MRIYSRLATVSALLVVTLLVGVIARRAGASGHSPATGQFALESAIAFVSTRDNPTARPLDAAEIYVMDADGSNPRRVTSNGSGDGFPALSPDGKKIVFDSNRSRTAEEPLNTDDLFIMDVDGSNQQHLVRGSSATWSPDGKNITYHASASGTGLPIKEDPGAATSDSDIFVLNVDDVLAGVAAPRNLTNNPGAIDDDPSWSPDGGKIAFTSHSVSDDPIDSSTAEIYVMSPDGASAPTRLTFNAEEERAPAWSPDGSRIVYMCRRGQPQPGRTTLTFELCVMNADGSGQQQLTFNAVGELTPTWSTDGARIAFHSNVGGLLQIFVMNADGTGRTQMTTPPGLNAFANWGFVRVKQ